MDQYTRLYDEEEHMKEVSIEWLSGNSRDDDDDCDDLESSSFINAKLLGPKGRLLELLILLRVVAGYENELTTSYMTYMGLETTEQARARIRQELINLGIEGPSPYCK